MYHSHFSHHETAQPLYRKPRGVSKPKQKNILPSVYIHKHRYSTAFFQSQTQGALVILLLFLVSLSLCLVIATAPINLLLQHNAIHTRLKQRKRQARFPLQLAQAIKDIRRRIQRQSIKYRSELR